MILDTKIQSNDFGEIHISPIQQNYDELGRFAYEPESKGTMTVFNVSGIYENLASDDVFSDISYLNSWKDQETMESAEYRQVLEHFNDNVYFLNGNLSKGGMFFYKDNEGLQFGCVYTFGTKTENDEVYGKYMIGATYDLDLSTDYELSEFCIGFLDSESEDYPSLIVFAKSTNASDVNEQIYYWIPADAQDEGYTTDSLLEAVSDNTHEDDTPNQAWADYGINYKRLYTIAPTDYDENSGSWNGGSVIDPSYNPYPDDAGQTPQEDNTQKHDTDKIELDDPNESGLDACNSGFVTLYCPTKQSVIDFNNYLFTDITDSISQQLKRLISDPFEYIVFIAMCHFTPTTSIAQHNILFAGIDSGISAPIINPQFKVLDCGEITIPYDNHNFTDFSPMSKAYIWIPYCGFRELKIDEIRGATLSLSYSIDMMTGSFVARLLAIRPLRGFWSNSQSKDYPFQSLILVAEGNCYEMLPISATDYRNFYNGLMGVIGGGMAITSGNVAGGLGSMGTSVMSMKPSVNRSGNPTGNYGYFGQQRAFVVIESPFGANPTELGQYEGYPSNLYLQIGSLATKNSNSSEIGSYVEIDTDTIWMNDIPCFDDEMNEIKDLLNKGVYVNDVEAEYN